MEDISKQIFNKKKKISLDMNEETLGITDKLAKISKNSRGAIIEAIINQGLPYFLQFLEKMWEGYLSDEKYEKVHKEIRKLLEDLKKLKSENKWLDLSYDWEKDLSKKKLNKETKKSIIKALRNTGRTSPNKEN